MLVTRRRLLGLASATALSAVTRTAQADEFPSRPITLVVQAAPGGASDLIARLMAEKLSANLGAPIVIDNMPAAGGNVALQRVIHSRPDGYTLLVCGSKSAIAESLFRSRPFNLSRDLVQVSPIGGTDLALVVNIASRLKNV